MFLFLDLPSGTKKRVKVLDLPHQTVGSLHVGFHNLNLVT